MQIDFSKYESLLIDRAFINIKNAHVAFRKGISEDVILEVFVNKECIVSNYFDKQSEVKLKELDFNCLAILKIEKD